MTSSGSKVKSDRKHQIGCAGSFKCLNAKLSQIENIKLAALAQLSMLGHCSGAYIIFVADAADIVCEAKIFMYSNLAPHDNFAFHVEQY